MTGGRESLVERGYLVDGAPVEDLATVVAMRSSPRVVAIADVFSGEERRALYFYGSAAGILEEIVDGEDHTFVLRGVDGAARSLADAADPDGRADDDGPLTRGPEAPPEVDEALAAADAVVRLYVVVRASEDEVQEFSASVASGPQGVWFVSGHADPATGDQEVWSRRLGRASLEVAFAQLLAGPVVEPV